MSQKSPTGEVQESSLSDVVGQAVQEQDSSIAESSTAAEDVNTNSEPDLDAVIRKAIEAKDGEGPEAPSTDGKSSEEQADEADDEADEPEETPEQKAKKEAEEDAKLPFGKHPRWKQVYEERKRYKQEAQQLTEKLKPLEEKAQQLDQIGGFMREHQLSGQEVTEGFQIMALMKTDPAKALEMLAPKLEALELATGKRLPPDLQQRVDAGDAVPEVAQEAARARMEAEAAKRRATELEQAQQREQATARQQAFRTAIDTWEGSVKASDPDYSKKQQLVLDRAKLLMAAEPPATPDAAVALAKRAYSEITEQLRSLLPRQPTRTITSDKSSTTAAPAPNSLEGIIRQAIGR